MVGLDTLPPPPPSRTGWPWTEQTSPVPERMPDGSPWPRVTIVTPSYNQGRFIEETIRSVLLQGYPNLEYIIMDGGSTDNSVEVIRKYEPWLAHWVSEKDRGQSHAINKGFARATGEVFGWLNSDDYFVPGALHTLMRLRSKAPQAPVWAGGWTEVEIDGRLIGQGKPRLGTREDMGFWGKKAALSQPSCLISAQKFRDVGGVDERFHYTMDVELWLRLRAQGPFAATDEVLSSARVYPEVKSLRDPAARDAEVIVACFLNGLPDQARQRLLDHVATQTAELRRYKESYNYIMNKPSVRFLRALRDRLRFFKRRSR